MPVTKTCEQCGVQYSRPPAVAKRSRFCSKACHDANQRTMERRTLTCKRCGNSFTSAQDHGKWPKFCSRECFKSGAAQPDWKVCPTCDGRFLATRSSHKSADGLRAYCSSKCAHKGARSGQERVCAYCKETFYLNAAKIRQRPSESCCSKRCQDAFYTESLARGWKGGAYETGGERFVRLVRDGYVCKYTGEHRAVAAKAIGRPLERGEVVIRINRNRSDNRPENLFICESNSEFSRRRNGSLPWPSESNLTAIANTPTS